MATSLRGSRFWEIMFIGAVLCAVCLLATVLRPSGLAALPGMSGSQEPHTLVIYIFSDSNPQYINNMNYFLQEAVKANDGAEYILVLQGGSDNFELPRLPPNARYVTHDNKCFDLGTVGWLINESGQVDVSKYKYIIWLNSSVRGPYLPNYIRGRVTWHHVLTELIDDNVKLVGSTISCSPTQHPDIGQYMNPHVQTYLVATDQVGLSVLQSHKQALSCHDTWQDAVLFGEVSTSKAILEAGYNLAALMMRYHGVDWRDPTNWKCNEEQSPLNVGSYDGITVDPLEVMFIKVKQAFVDAEWPNVLQALKYDEWVEARRGDATQNITSNQYLVDRPKQLERLKKRGEKCFDAPAYRKASPYEFQGRTDAYLWYHFKKYGFLEGRPYKMLC